MAKIRGFYGSLSLRERVGVRGERGDINHKWTRIHTNTPFAGMTDSLIRMNFICAWLWPLRVDPRFHGDTRINKNTTGTTHTTGPVPFIVVIVVPVVL